MMDATVTAAIRLYEQGISYKEIARRLNISEPKAKKILITAGLYETDRSREISKLSAQGLTVSEIAEKLGISAKAVNALMPYDKGMYNAEYPSENAQRIRRCRAKSKEGDAQ